MAHPDHVLVVGAGPTGQALALALSSMGVRPRVIDKATARSPHSRALIVQPRTLELLSPYGVSEGLVARGRTGLHARVYVDREVVASLDFGAFDHDDTAFPFPLFISQAETERALDEAMAARGLSIERGVELRDAEDLGDRVRVVLGHPEGGEETLEVGWLVGCDGAHSLVRKRAGLSFEGDAYPGDFMLADLHLDSPVPEGSLSLFMSRRGVFAVLPLGGPGRVRIIATRSGGGPDAPPGLDELQAIADELMPAPTRLSDPAWLARFRLHHRCVDRYRSGRMFVAGDAAHIHSPAGGQGMNTGIQDAINLGWKLGLVCRGQASPALLDTYDVERARVGRKLVRFTDRLFSVASSDNLLLWTARRLLVPWLAPRVTADPARRARAWRFMSQRGIRYPVEGAVVPDGALPDARAPTGGAAPGARGPGGRLKDGQGAPLDLHALLDPGAFHLLCFEGAGPHLDLGPLPEGVRAWTLRTRAADEAPEALLDEGGALHGRHGMGAEAGWVLLRPDGHIAARGLGDPRDGLYRSLALVLGDVAPAHAAP